MIKPRHRVTLGQIFDLFLMPFGFWTVLTIDNKTRIRRRWSAQRIKEFRA